MGKIYIRPLPDDVGVLPDGGTLVAGVLPDGGTLVAGVLPDEGTLLAGVLRFIAVLG